MMGAFPITVSFEDEESKLNECGRHGWELFNSVVRKYKGQDWVYHYFRREIKEGEENTEKPRFDTGLFKVG